MLEDVCFLGLALYALAGYCVGVAAYIALFIGLLRSAEVVVDPLRLLSSFVHVVAVLYIGSFLACLLWPLYLRDVPRWARARTNV